MFNTKESGNQTLIFRPEGLIWPAYSEHDTHFTVAETTKSYEGISVTPYGKIEPGNYDLYWNNDKLSNINLPQGGVHTFVINGNDSQDPEFLDFLLTEENSVHMLWLVPQYFVITVGEIMFSITALEFSYSQVSYSKNITFCKQRALLFDQ